MNCLSLSGHDLSLFSFLSTWLPSVILVLLMSVWKLLEEMAM